MHARDRHDLAVSPHLAAPPRATAPAGSAAAMLNLQRAAGNRAAGIVVQRATKKQEETARRQADTDHDAGKTSAYFAGHFEQHHIRTMEVSRTGKGKTLRGAAVEAWADRSAGGGWGGAAQRPRGTNSILIDTGSAKRQVMRSLNVAQIDPLQARNHAYLNFQTEDKVPLVTVTTGDDGISVDGDRTSGIANLGAVYNADLNRFQINHLGGLA